MRNKDLDKFLFLLETRKETDFTEEVNPFNDENYERDKEHFTTFAFQESCNNNITSYFEIFPFERNIFDNINLLELNEEPNDDDILKSDCFFIKPKENKKKIFIINKEIKKPQNRIKRGRKIKKESGKGKHSKNDEDNIIRKIKAHFFKYVNETLNKSIKSSWHKFENIPYDMIKKSSIEYNIHLMNLSLKDIYNESINYIDKYERRKYQRNKNTLIYLSKKGKENEEKVINLLNLNFIQFFDNFRKEYLPTFLDEINPLTKNKKSYKDNNKLEIDENIDEKELSQYLSKVEYICNNFETLLFNKLGSSK